MNFYPIKCLLSFSLVCFLGSPIWANICVPEPGEKLKVVGVKSDDTLNVREGYTTKYKVVAELLPNQESIEYVDVVYKSEACSNLCANHLAVISKNGTVDDSRDRIKSECRSRSKIWYKISTNDGTQGWASAKYLDGYTVEQVSLKQDSSTQSGLFHLVSKGDTAYSISKKYDISLADLASLNNLDSSYSLSLGQKLKISSVDVGSNTNDQEIQHQNNNAKVNLEISNSSETADAKPVLNETATSSIDNSSSEKSFEDLTDNEKYEMLFSFTTKTEFCKYSHIPCPKIIEGHSSFYMAHLAWEESCNENSYLMKQKEIMKEYFALMKILSGASDKVFSELQDEAFDMGAAGVPDVLAAWRLEMAFDPDPNYAMTLKCTEDIANTTTNLKLTFNQLFAELESEFSEIPMIWDRIEKRFPNKIRKRKF